MPLFPDWEGEWHVAVKIIVYLAGLFWLFSGVSVIAEIFMAAIEKVTSARRRVNKNGKIVTVKVWNGTVANLTLMALGSSAPEILLSLIELIFTERWNAGDLGPGTIVGSAAFNLLVIIAVCMVSLPPDEYRAIKDVGVFGVTAFFSVFAYLWLVFILMGPSPDVVTVLEGVITFLFMPLLVTLAYLMDIGYFHKKFARLCPRPLVLKEDSTPEEHQAMLVQLERKYGRIPPEDHDKVALMYYEFAPPMTRAAHRVNATRQINGGKTCSQADRDTSRWLRGKEVAQALKNPDVELATSAGAEPPADAEVSFKCSHYAVAESEKKVRLEVVLCRNTNSNELVKVAYKTRDGTAQSQQDYKQAAGTLHFAPEDNAKTLEIQVYEDQKWEPAEEFYVELKVMSGPAILGKVRTATVVILDSDGPGQLAFDTEEMSIEPTTDTITKPVIVRRTNGTTGEVSCQYRTEDGSAKKGADYTETTGTLCFKNGQTEAQINLEILPKSRYERVENFRLFLEEPSGGVTFALGTDGGADCNILTIIILADPTKSTWEAFMSKVNWDEMNIGNARYKDQFIEAVFVGGSREAQKEASKLDWALHIWSVPWKLLFAVVPPTDFVGGWVTFFSALGMIGILTAIIGDMANLLGCSLNMKAPVVAVTLVALGTSLPDTFASMISTAHDPTADASIGNVTGSNSVNVFLGLGMPWALGALYWQINGATPEWEARGREKGWWDEQPHIRRDHPNGAFVVVGGNLGKGVGVFCVVATFCIALLMVRRRFLGGELGGDKKISWLCAGLLVLLWCVYIGCVILFEGGLTPYE